MGQIEKDIAKVVVFLVSLVIASIAATAAWEADQCGQQWSESNMDHSWGILGIRI